MSILCNHSWEPRSGMDSGAICSICGKITNREISQLSCGLTDAKLEKFKFFCQHNWQSRSGMDSGCVCTICGKTTNKEINNLSSNNNIINKIINNIKKI